MNEILGNVRVTRKGYAAAAAKVRERATAPPSLTEKVSEIVENVRHGGDRVLLGYAKELDGVRIKSWNLRVPRSEIASAASREKPAVTRALRIALARIAEVQGSLLRRAGSSITFRGFKIRARPEPLQSVGCYVPGGRASYASTVLMTAGVAKLAGVKRVVLCTPASTDGSVNAAILTAASIAGVDEVYRVGGPHAIAAMAYGTESINRVEKIVGPGGRYVSAAKRYVSRDVNIDFYAGPTELVVLADRSCDPRLAGWELIGQAEHGEDSLSGLVTFSEDYSAKVRLAIKEALPGLERRGYVEGCLRNGFAAVCDSEATAFDFINALAPEHLAVLTRRPERANGRVRNAGLKLLGRNSPCAASDYLVGTDHVIPTAGVSSSRGPLSALDFVKLDWSVKGSASGLRGILPELETLARAEGLPNHYLSVRARFED